MTKSRYHPSEDPVLQAFKDYWAVPLDELLQGGYLKGKKSWDEISARITNPQEDVDKAILSDLKIKLGNKQKEVKEGLTQKEIFLLGYFAQLTKDYLDAHSYFNQIKGLDGDAEQFLGYMYKMGDGINQDYAQAIQYYQDSAHLGNTDSLNNLAWMYEKGLGVNVDSAKAIDYYRQAAVRCSTAAHNLGVAYNHGEGVEKDETLAIYYYEEAIKSGSISTLHRIGKIYQNRGGTFYCAKAATYFRYAAEKNIQNARKDLEELYHYHYTPDVGYHAAIVLGLPEELNKLAIKNPDIFDELFRDDDWNKIEPLLKPDVAKIVIERNKAYFAEHQYVLEQKTALPSGVSNLILSYTTKDQHLLKGLGQKTDEIRTRETKAQQALLELEANKQKKHLEKETQRQKPLLDEWKKKRKEALSQKEKEPKDPWLFSQPNPDTRKTASITELTPDPKKRK